MNITITRAELTAHESEQSLIDTLDSLYNSKSYTCAFKSHWDKLHWFKVKGANMDIIIDIVEGEG